MVCPYHIPHPRSPSREEGSFQSLSTERLWLDVELPKEREWLAALDMLWSAWPTTLHGLDEVAGTNWRSVNWLVQDTTDRSLASSFSSSDAACCSRSPMA